MPKFKKWIHKIKKIYTRYRIGYDPIKPQVSPTVCAVPWMHLNFEPNGKVVPCCLTSTYNYFAGDLNTQPIEEIWNSTNMKILRKEMMSGREPEICRKCFDKEKVTGESGRVHHNREFPHVIKSIPIITSDDGSVKEMNLRYWDFRFSNLCNFKCRSCGPRYSSAWVPDAKKLGWKIEDEKVTSIDGIEEGTNYNFLEDQIGVVEKIYFAGGEPLLMPEHWQILELLVKHKRFDVKLSYNTNVSTLTYGGKNVIDYWKQWNFGKLEVWPSIDEIGPRAELIRSGTVWSKVENNLIELSKLDNIILRPGITVGAMNIFRLPEIIEYLKNIGVLKQKHHYNNFYLNLLEQPSHYHVHILDDNFRAETIIKLEIWITKFNLENNTDISSKFTQMIHELKKPRDLHALKRFFQTTEQIDTVRNENTYEIIPELSRLKKEI
jgi:radical SAM protein with 4Fe4S-binding SPASM domain